MKKILVSMICFCLALHTSAQEQQPKLQEIGFTFSNLDRFGVTYRVGTEETLWRFSTFSAGGQVSNSTIDSTERSLKSHGVTFAVGKEFRKSLEGNFELRYGLDLGFSYLINNSEIDDISVADRDQIIKRREYIPRVNFVIGANYQISENLIVGAELLPGVSYTISDGDGERPITGSFDESQSRFSYNLSTSSALLSVMYRF